MKTKYLTYLAVLCASLCLQFSCTIENGEEPEPDVRLIPYHVTVNGAQTKASLNGSTQYVFEGGDRLFVNHIEGGDVKMYGILTLVSGVGNTTAEFQGDLACVDGFTPTDNTPLFVTLLGEADVLHSISADGRRITTNYPATVSRYAPSFLQAVRKYSDFTDESSRFGDHSFTLNQKSAFLVFSIKMNSGDVPQGNVVTCVVKNGAQVLCSGGAVASSVSGSVSHVTFALAVQGGISLSDAVVSIEKADLSTVEEPITNSTLEANKYYTINRSLLDTYEGFRIIATKANTTVTFDANYAGNIEYSVDGGINWISGTTPCTLVNKDDEMWVRGDRTNYTNYEGADYDTPSTHPLFSTSDSKLVYIAGNIMSLLNDAVTLEASAFHGTFSKGSSNLTYIDISGTDPLYLPVTTLANKCYTQMFRQCTSLTHAPTFTVEGAAYRCCYNMFRGCTKLSDVSTISLPANQMYEDCYREMFRACSGLATVASGLLPATNLAANCYQQMFQESKITSAPELPAANLTSHCYHGMFLKCKQLAYIKCLAQTGINSTNCNNWVDQVASSGTFVKYTGISWTTNASGIPSGWTVEEYP